MYGKNESSIRGIVKQEKEIRATLAVAPETAKVMATVRDKCLVKVEKALNLWLEDMNRNGVTVDNNVLCRKALTLYEDFSKGSPETNDSKPFIASRGWLHRFRNRFGLRSVKLTEEAAPAEDDAVATFPEELKELIEEKGYHPKQVFSCNETGLFWKKMPERTYIQKCAKQAPGCQLWKDRLTLILCGNTAGHMIKPGVVYRAKNPRALKDKDKSYLPVFWQHHRHAWLTDSLFIEWFRQCFILEAKEYFEQEGLPFKALLIVNSAPGHPESVCCEDGNVDVVFLPPQTTSLLQPLDQGAIRCVKATYTRLVFDRLRSAMDADPNLDIMKCWESFSIADAVSFIGAAVDGLTPETVNACWKNLWGEVVNDFKGFPEIDREVRKITEAARRIGGEGFVDMIDEEVKEHIESHREVLTNEEWEELVKSSTEDEEEEKVKEEAAEEPAMWTVEKFAEVFQIAQALKDKITESDPRMERSIKVNRMLTEALQPLQQYFDELKKMK
nr:tigger transposable element-derived protein 1-like [Pogona vitticeps]